MKEFLFQLAKTFMTADWNNIRERRGSMFDYDETLDILRDFKHLNSKKRRKVMTALFYDDSFIEWLYLPKKVPNLTELVEDMYTEFIETNTMRAMIDTVYHEGYHEFTRSHATFMYTVANIAIERNNEFLDEYSKKKKEGDISSKELRRLSDKIDEKNEVIVELLKTAKKIIKRDASLIASDSRLPKYIAVSTLTSVPEYKFIDTPKIGFYLNNLLSMIYSEVEENGEFERGVRWRVFFKEIFGKDNLAEVAMFILLEGVHRIDKYENSDDVKLCWNSLTDFALNELNDVPGTLRQQMIELYIKRIDQMFMNKNFDLRVDLLNINEEVFPNLANTVSKYSDKISAILNRNK